MALGTKFRIEGTSDIFGKVTVNIKLDGYTGSVIDLDGVGRNWVELKIGDNSNDISNPILAGKLTVQFYVMTDFATTELGRSESFTYYVEALDGLGDLIWAGWVIPDEYKEAYHNTPYIATLVASDGLEELKNVNYPILSGKATLFQHIQNCLFSTNIGFSFFESINIYSNGMDSNAADSPLKQAQVTYNSFLNIGETPNKYDVLRSILQPFLARIYQYRGWRIENILEKRGSYVVREYDSAGAYVDQETFDPLVKFDTDYADYRAFIQKTGQLSIRPSLNNAEVYFNTVEPAEETATGGFQKAEDWTSSTELVEWTAVGSNITIEQVTSSFDGNEFAVKIPGKRSSLEQTNYLESNSYPIDSADYETINIEFAHYADYPSIIILGSKPILYFEIIFTETAAADSYNWTGSAWELIPTGQPRKRLRIDFSNRQRWTRYSVSIDRVPADGNIKFRFYKLIKSGSEGVTELRLTAWKSNLVIQEPRNAKILLEYASGQAITTYKGPSFAHIISDGLIVNAAGVMDVDNVLTDEWSRRGITDELNIRRLFLLQWLSLNATPTELLSGTIHQKGEVITPMSVVKDKDAVSSVRYVMQSWSFSLSNGIGAANYREILLTDTNINAFQDFVDSIRFGDYFSFTTISPIFIFGAPGLSDGANTGPFELPNFTLNGDVRGQLGQSELTPAAIVNKARLDLIGLTASDIVFNAVKDSPDQENMTNLRLIDTYDVLDETFVPYTGAKEDVDLGPQGITTEWVKLNTTPVIPTDQGSLYWDEDDNVLAVVLNGAIQKVGEVTFYNVKNQTGSTIAKGTGVGFAGVVGASARIKVAPFLADGSQPSIYYVGITAEEILDGEDGKVYNFGPIRGLNTSAFSEGDVLYASPTVAGGFTTTPPTAPNNVIVVAAVLTDSATVGALLVRVTVADLGYPIVHNETTSKQGGDGTNFFHLGQEDYDSVVDNFDLTQIGTEWISKKTISESWAASTFANGTYVVVGASGDSGDTPIMYSFNGIDFTRVGVGNGNKTCVAYGNGLFVTHGVNDSYYTSPDGINWTVRTNYPVNGAGLWASITFGNGIFVVVRGLLGGFTIQVLTSSDGINWTLRNSSIENNWTSVTFGNGLFVAVASSGTGNRVMTSPDGITWTTRTSAADNDWRSVTFGNNLFVAVSNTGTGNRVMTSPDGITWTIRTNPADNNWTSVTFGNGVFVAVANSGTGNRAMTSTDGVTWTIRTTPRDEPYTSIVYGNERFVAIANSGGIDGVFLMYSNQKYSLRHSNLTLDDGRNPHGTTASDVGAEPSFVKGSLVAGTNVTLSGTLVSRLVGSGNVTINATVPTITTGNIVAGVGVTLDGTATDRLFGTGNLTFNVNRNIDGGNFGGVYLEAQNINGGVFGS